MELSEAHRELEGLADQLSPAPGVVELRQGVLTIDAPETRGALSGRMMAQLAACVVDLQSTSEAVVRLEGVGSAFCSGGNLDQVRAGLGSPAAGHRMARAMSVVLDALRSSPALIVACVRGPAVGGGAELTTAADLVLAAPSAWIQFRQARLGVTTGWGGGARLAQRVGRSRALWLLTTGVRVSAADAVGLGLVDSLEIDGTLSALAAAEPDSVRSMKRLVDHPGEEVALFADRWGSPSHLARVPPAKKREDER